MATSAAAETFDVAPTAQDTTPEPAPASMRAIGHHRYGGPDVLEVFEKTTPRVGDKTVLVRVEALALNPLDWHMMTGTPWLVRLQAGLRKPKQPVRGVDFAGRVVEVGGSVSRFAVGDEVAGLSYEAGAEFVAVGEERLVHKPANVTFAEAAGVGVAAVTALQGLRDKANLQPDQHVLVNGASGGVGLAAIQVSKWMGAQVTAVCSTRNLELVRSVGADHVIDYTTEDYTSAAGSYDVLFDNQGNHNLASNRRVLSNDGVYLLVGGPKKNRAFGPILRMLRALAYFGVFSQSAKTFIADENGEDLQVLADLLATGELRTIVDTTYSFDDVGAAMEHLGAGHARGKVVLVP